MFSHEGKIAVVTGAGRGIGQAAARTLAEHGATVVCVDLSSSGETLRLLEEAGRPGIEIVADVSDPEGTARVGEIVREEYGRCDILVNNAGIFPFALLEDLDYALWRKVLGVNLDSQFLMVKALSPLMGEGGRIVNITSNSIVTEDPGLAHYMASKMGVIGFTRGLANELGPRGITVNAVGPALTRTPGVIEAIPDDFQERISSRQAIKRIAVPEDIVGAILLLTSDEAHFITGQTLMADGGMAKGY